jgi:hypothetical protein
MIIELNWQAVAVLLTITLAWSGFLIGVIRWLITRMMNSFETRITEVAQSANEAKEGLKGHREEYLRFLGELPIQYYRREDMIRFETITHAKLDALAGDIRQLECRKCPTTMQ